MGDDKGILRSLGRRRRRRGEGGGEGRGGRRVGRNQQNTWDMKLEEVLWEEKTPTEWDRLCWGI